VINLIGVTTMRVGGRAKVATFAVLAVHHMKKRKLDSQRNDAHVKR